MKKLCSLLLSLVLVVTLMPVMSAASLASAATEPVAPGVYRIRPASSDTRVLDIAGGSAASGANVQIYRSNNTAAQFFELSVDAEGLYTIVSVGSGCALDVKGAGTEAGTDVWQYERNGTAAQKWIPREGTDGRGARVYTFTSALSPDLVLDVAGARDEDGTNVGVWTANGTAAQSFYLIPVEGIPAVPASLSDGLYTFTSALASSLVLDVPGASSQNGVRLQIYARNDTVAQVFAIKLEADGFYSIHSVASGCALDVDSNHIVSTTTVWQYADNGTDAQRWALLRNADGSLTLLAKSSGLALDVENGSAVSGTPLQLYHRNGTPAQSFYLTPASTDTLPVGIVSLASATDGSLRVDIAGASRQPGARAQFYASNSTAAQKFEMARVAPNTYTFRSLASGLYLTGEDASVLQRPDSGAASRWKAEWVYGGIRWTNTATKRALAVSGTELVLADPTGDITRAFRILPVDVIEPGAYTVDTSFGPVLDVAGGRTVSGTPVQLWGANDTGAQKWTVSSVGDGYYTLTGAASGRALDVAGASTAEGTPVQIYTPNGTAAQKWRPVPSGDGYYLLLSALGTYLTTPSDSPAGTVVRTTPDAVAALRFSFTPTVYVPPIDIVEMYRPVFYHGPKGASHQKYIVLHDTEGDGNPASVINWWAGNGNLVAAHFVIGKDGSVYQCVPLDTIAHHAGYGNSGNNSGYGVPEDGRDDMRGSAWVGSWASDYGMNAYSIGIEMVHVGGSGYYPEAQLKALDELIAYIDAYYGFESSIIDHKAWRSGNSDTSREFAPYLSNYQRYRTHSGA